MTTTDAISAQVADLFSKLSVGTSEDRKGTAQKLAQAVKSANNIHCLQKCKVIEQIKTDAENLKSAPAREGALLAFTSICETVPVSDVYLAAVLNVVLERYGDKAPEVRKAAEEAGNAFVKVVSPHGIKMLLPTLFQAIEHGIKWQTKLGAISILRNFIVKAPKQVRLCLPDIMPSASGAMWDTKADVKNAASAAMMEACRLVGNPDIEAFIPALIQTIANPTEVPDCVYRLAATTFVTTVEAPALAIMMPLLVRGLAEPVTAVKRQTAVIIDNMCKLVADPSEAEFFLPKLLPGLERIIEVGADPELRSVCERARKTLLRAGGKNDANAHEETISAVKKVANEDSLLVNLKAVLLAVSPKSKDLVEDAFFVTLLKFTCSLASELVEHKNFEAGEWVSTLSPYFTAFIAKDVAEATAKAFVAKCVENVEAEKASHEEPDEEGEDLCNCEFSLAYGGMILLNSTKLHLKRGRRYGLCGPNGVGKSTLMRAIANGQLDGFPPQDQLKTVFVEHNLQASQAELSVVDFVLTDPMTKDIPKEEALKTLYEVGFNDEFQRKQVSALSGGWKMKLELARAMMVQADILLLDEPTNHLDKRNVKWLESYLTNLPNVTSMIVSHDSGFLDNVCTDIIHYEQRKLKRYKGNLSEFVRVKPEAKAYYTLESSQFKFKLPEPGFLDGVNTKDKAILKLSGVTYQYPGNDKLQLNRVSIACSLSSRVAVVGPNGAGKSTLIKVMTEEVVPTSGDVYRHPNLRLAYVAQHAFHHLEDHLDKTPNQYIQWRFQYGEDKELLEKQTRQLTDEDRKIMDQKILVEGEKRQIECFVGRRKLKKSFEYEIKFRGLPHEENHWFPRDQLEKWGFNKMVQAFDDKEAAKAGAYTRPLTAANVQKHLEELGLDPEFSSHSFIKGLSGGQKVKVVIGACTWNNPHMLILDEPSNYLDRDSLAALSAALKEYGGGVVIISHNSEFVDTVCPEKWDMEDGTLTISGEITTKKEKIEQVEVEESFDAFGNKIKLKSQKKLSKKEIRAKNRRKEAARKRGEEVSEDEEEDWPEDL